MKALGMLFYMRYGGPICCREWLSYRPKCMSSLHEAGTPQKHTHLIPICWRNFKIFYQQVAMNVLFQMRYDSKHRDKKLPSDRLRGWESPCSLITLVLLIPLASKTCLNNLGSNTVTALSRSGYHISFERGDLELSVDTKKFIFTITRYCLSQVQTTWFQHGFLVCRGLPASLYVLVCHSVTCWSRSAYHMENKRGHP